MRPDPWVPGPTFRPARHVLPCLLPVTPRLRSVFYLIQMSGLDKLTYNKKLCLLQFSSVVQSLTNVFIKLLLSIYYSRGLFLIF